MSENEAIGLYVIPLENGETWEIPVFPALVTSGNEVIYDPFKNIPKDSEEEGFKVVGFTDKDEVNIIF